MIRKFSQPADSLVFILDNLPDLPTLVAGLPDGAELHWLNAEDDALEQMAAVLASRSRLDAIHLFSHGRPGALELGAVTLSRVNLGSYAERLRDIGAALGEDGDLLLYGCEVAQGQEGRAFVEGLSRAAGAYVAAASHKVGASGQGGDWTLDAMPPRQGRALAVEAWRGVLAGSRGWTSSDFGIGSQGRDVKQLSDGRIVVAGSIGGYFGRDFGLAYYYSDGSLDYSFGNDGKVTTDFGGDDYGSSVVVQNDGKFVVAGSVYTQNGTAFLADFAVARYNSDGSLDSSFSGDGKAITDFGGYDFGSSVVLQGDKIVVAGVSSNNFALARYNSDGSLDTSFDGDGKVTTDFSGSAYSVTLDSNGKFMVVGHSNNTLALARYNSDGSLDTSFDGDGKVSTDLNSRSVTRSVTNTALQSDGKIVVAVDILLGGYERFVLTRYNSNGSLDTTFGDHGKIISDFSGSAESVAVQSDGKIVVAGYAHENDGNYYHFALARFNSDGSLDSSFSGDGKVITDFGSSGGVGRSVALQGDGKILLAGESYTQQCSYGNFALARYNSDGSMDLTFGDKTGWLPQASDSASATEDDSTPVTGNVLSNDSGNGTIVATALNGLAISSGASRTYEGSYGILTLNSDGSYSYQLDNSLAGVQALGVGATATDVFGYTMKDSLSSLGYATLTVTVTGVNDAPVAHGVEGFATVAGTAFNYSFADTAFTDVDSGDTLTYTAQQVDVNGAVVGDGSLPAGITFDSASRTFSGTAAVAADNYWFTVTASDGHGGSATSTFAMEVKTSVSADTRGKYTGGDGDELITGTTGGNKMAGGNGDDTYLVNDKKDQITEGANGGTDTVVASIDYKLGKNVENLTLLNKLNDADPSNDDESDANLKGTGNDLANTLTGNRGDNVLDGGKGVDTYYGGEGGDTYILDDMAEAVTVFEYLGEGTDTIQLNINNLAAGAGNTFVLADNIENLILTGSAAIDLTGNGLDNTITGNAKNNTLTGLDGNDTLDGGKGSDTLIGGAGDDTYYVDTGDKFDSKGVLTKAGDSVQEGASAGTDTVISSASSYTMAEEVENLTLAKAGKGVGNGGDNSITGSSKNDNLDGGAGDDTIDGGLGKDQLTGGDGSDTFVFDSALSSGNVDKITDFVSGGTDTIRLSSTVFGAVTDIASNFQSASGHVAASEAALILYDTDTGKLWYDADGSGTGKAVQFAVLVGIKPVDLAATDFEMGF